MFAIELYYVQIEFNRAFGPNEGNNCINSLNNQQVKVVDSIYLTFVCIFVRNFHSIWFHQKVLPINGIDLLMFDIDFSNYEHWPRLSQGWLNIDKITMVNTLRLHRMNIDGINADAFNCPEFAEMQMLEIKGMPINILKEGVFNGLKKLRILTLNQIIIDRFEANVLVPVPNLETFKLTCASQSELSLDNLFGTYAIFNLESITVKFCNLNRTINANTFSGLRNISELRLTSNHIEEIAPKSFDIILNTVTYINLRMNALQNIPKNLFKNPNLAISILINDNPWHCNCNLDHLKAFMANKKNMVIDRVICNTPRKHSGVALIETANLCSKSEENQDHSIHVKCQPTNFINVTLTKSRQPNRSIYSKNGQLFVVNDNPKHFQVIRIKQSIDSDHDDDVKCMAHLKQKKSLKNDKISSVMKSNLLPGEIYRFCSMRKMAQTVTPLECVTIYPRYIGCDASVWILQKHKPLLVIAFIFAIAHAFIIGMVVTIASIKLLPKYVQKWRQKDGNIQTTDNPNATSLIDLWLVFFLIF